MPCAPDGLSCKYCQPWDSSVPKALCLSSSQATQSWLARSHYPKNLWASASCKLQTSMFTLQLMCKAAASHRKIQHRSCQCLSHTHCGFHWNPRAARTLLCASEPGLTHPAATHRLLRSAEGAQRATALGSPQGGGRVWSICLLLHLNYYWYCSSDWWFSTTIV